MRPVVVAVEVPYACRRRPGTRVPEFAARALNHGVALAIFGVIIARRQNCAKSLRTAQEARCIFPFRVKAIGRHRFSGWRYDEHQNSPRRMERPWGNNNNR